MQTSKMTQQNYVDVVVVLCKGLLLFFYAESCCYCFVLRLLILYCCFEVGWAGYEVGWAGYEVG